MNNKINKIVAISIGSFPYGGAVTNRHISYLKGLVEMGVDVHILLLARSVDHSILSNQSEGEFSGIKFKYGTFDEVKKKLSLNKIMIRIKGLLRIRSYLINKFLPDQNTALLFLVVDPVSLYVFRKLAKKFKMKIFHERMEYPFIHRTNTIKKLWIYFYLYQLKYLNGLYVISSELAAYYKKYIDIKKIFLLPMTVEPDRFNIPKTACSYGDYIAYCGTMHSNKDGVPCLIKAFDIFASHYPYVNLVLIGDNSNRQVIEDVLYTASKANHKNRIYFTGKLERNEIPNLLVNARVLALARSANKQAKGGFPTKLGEYLATGNPVVVTKVGEIPYYLEHKKSAYLAEPDDPNDFAEKLKEIFNDYAKARKIGLEGKNLAFSVFNYKIQAKRLLEFIN